jgi:hypothetical protein
MLTTIITQFFSNVLKSDNLRMKKICYYFEIIFILIFSEHKTIFLNQFFDTIFPYSIVPKKYDELQNRCMYIFNCLLSVPKILTYSTVVWDCYNRNTVWTSQQNYQTACICTVYEYYTHRVWRERSPYSGVQQGWTIESYPLAAMQKSWIEKKSWNGV